MSVKWHHAQSAFGALGFSTLAVLCGLHVIHWSWFFVTPLLLLL